MPFILMSPYGKKRKAPIVITTTNILHDQLWQELVVLRYLKDKNNIVSPKLIAYWIDQAKTYYLDACNADWRSGGLLYYYSFLNLAKALLVAKKRFSFKSLNETSIHHGLSARIQEINNLMDFEIEIFPPIFNNRRNVFSNLYEKVTGTNWPFKNKISLKLINIIGYCNQITTEIRNLFHVENKTILIQSMYRQIGNEAWFEMLIPLDKRKFIEQHLANWEVEIINFNKITHEDKAEWQQAYGKTAQMLAHYFFIRTMKHLFNENNLQEHVNTILSEMLEHLEEFVVPPIELDISKPSWLFIPNLDLAGKNIRWHPLLSNYLISFSLSAILRYQPQLIIYNTPDYFISQAWCSQSARETLQQFLLLFTDPPILVQP